MPIRPPGRIPHPKQFRRRVNSHLPISPRYSSNEVSRLGIPRCILKIIILTLGSSCLRNNARNLYTKCSPNRIVEVMKGSPSEPKLKALSELGFSGITSIKMTSVGNEFMHWILEVYNVETIISYRPEPNIEADRGGC
ncbi:hypothetical protein LINPERPRIM_LOCUS18882 [Linum perenne]